MLWGVATPSEIVRVSFIGRIYLAIADPKSGEFHQSPVRLMHRVTSGAVCAGKWRVCVDTTNLLGGPFQMVFTTNGIKQVLDNVYVLVFLSAFCFSVTDACSSSGSLATRHHPVPTTRSTQSRLLTPVRRLLIPLAGHRALACTNPSTTPPLQPCVKAARLNRYLSFDDCGTPDYDASAVKNEVFLSGSCKSAGFRGSAWQFDNHFLLIDGIGGYFGGPVTLAVWFRLLKSPANGTDSLILGIGVRGSVLNMGIVVSSQCASECVC